MLATVTAVPALARFGNIVFDGDKVVDFAEKRANEVAWINGGFMQIVPRADELVVEAKVAPNDIDQVAVGAEAVVRVLAGNQRTMPVITGRLTRVSADLTREQQQNSAQPAQAYYTVRIVLPAEEIARLRDIHLLPGMPVEVFIRTHERSPLQYLLKPLQDQIARTFRER